MTIDFLDHYLTLHFSNTPYKGTNVSSIELGLRLPREVLFSYVVENADHAMLAKRDKCYNCAASVVYANQDGTLEFVYPRLQAYLPKKHTAAADFSHPDPESICSVTPVTGFDAALYFGIGIGILGGVGLVLYLQNFFCRCNSNPRGYSAIN